MTIIAWDGQTLAADKRSVNNFFKGGTITKVHRWPGGLCAFSGEVSMGMQMVEWLRSGANPADHPKQQAEKCHASLMVIYADGRRALYESTPVPVFFENKFHAMGSGRDYALAAMHLGFDARLAVEVACALDTECGNGIDTLQLKPPIQ